MKWLKRSGLLLMVVLAGLFAVQWAASETTGEVISITTFDDAGKSHETRLWVVDSGGEAWIRAGSDTAGWYARVLSNPKVSMTRGGETNNYTAIAVPEATDTVNGLMRAKYNWGEKVISRLINRSASVAVRLEPAH